MDETNDDCDLHIPTFDFEGALRSLQDLYEHNLQYVDCSPTCTDYGLSRLPSASGSIVGLSEEISRLSTRSPRPSGAALQCRPLSETSSRQAETVELNSAPLIEGNFRQPLRACLPQHDTGNPEHGVDFLNQQVPPSFSRNDLAPTTAAHGSQGWKMMRLDQHDPAFWTVNEDHGTAQAIQLDASSQQPCQPCPDTRQVQRTERRRWQNRRAQQAYRARRDQLITNRENQILSMGQQHAADVEEIRRLQKLLERLESDNDALRNWIKLHITMQGFVLEPVTMTTYQDSSG